jgi:hypothetical protein
MYQFALTLNAMFSIADYSGHEVWRMRYNASSTRDLAAIDDVKRHLADQVGGQLDIWTSRFELPLATIDVLIPPHSKETTAQYLQARRLSSEVIIHDVNDCDHRYQNGVPPLLPKNPQKFSPRTFFLGLSAVS